MEYITIAVKEGFLDLFGLEALNYRDSENTRWCLKSGVVDEAFLETNSEYVEPDPEPEEPVDE